MTTKQIMQQLMEQNAEILKNLDSLNERVTTIEKSSKTKKTTSKSEKAQKSKTSEPKKTREEALTEKFGDKEQRTKYVELRKKVAEEFSALAKANEVYIPKRKYQEVLKNTTEALNGKFNKATVKKMFLSAAK